MEMDVDAVCQQQARQSESGQSESEREGEMNIQIHWGENTTEAARK